MPNDPSETAITASPPVRANLQIARPVSQHASSSPAPLSSSYLGSSSIESAHRLAVISAVCGLIPILPVISQVAGIILGITALRRIGRFRAAGVMANGTGWAITGLISSIVSLIGWIVIFLVLGLVISVFAHSAETLDQIATLPTP